LVFDLTTSGSGGLESLDNVQGLLISNLTEDDVLTIEPAGDNGGDEELRTVAAIILLVGPLETSSEVSLRIWSSVGHGEKSWLGVLSLEVLIGKLLTVNGLSTGTLYHCEHCSCIVQV
jgi:hypothetical protein